MLHVHVQISLLVKGEGCYDVGTKSKVLRRVQLKQMSRSPALRWSGEVRGGAGLDGCRSEGQLYKSRQQLLSVAFSLFL